MPIKKHLEVGIQVLVIRTEKLFRFVQRLVPRLLVVVEPLDVCEERVEVLVGELAPRSPEEGFAVDLRGRRSRRRGSVTRTSPAWSVTTTSIASSARAFTPSWSTAYSTRE